MTNKGWSFASDALWIAVNCVAIGVAIFLLPFDLALRFMLHVMDKTMQCLLDMEEKCGWK